LSTNLSRATLAALDVLALEIDQQPAPPIPNRFDKLLLRLGAAMGLDLMADVVAKLLHRASYGRRVDELTDRLSLASTQLRLIAPEPVLSIMAEVEAATRRSGPDGRDFKREWDAVRDDVRLRMRQELDRAGSPSSRRTLARRKDTSATRPSTDQSLSESLAAAGSDAPEQSSGAANA
jgi:hypothetical protein